MWCLGGFDFRLFKTLKIRLEAESKTYQFVSTEDISHPEKASELLLWEILLQLQRHEVERLIVVRENRSQLVSGDLNLHLLAISILSRVLSVCHLY